MDYVQLLIQGTASTVALVLILKWTVPSLISAFREELKAEREIHNRHVELMLIRLERIEAVLFEVRADTCTPRVAPIPSPVVVSPKEIS
jgi:hypothetical protein